MAQDGAYYTYVDGQVITLRDLLEKELGHCVSDAEAMEYVLRQHKQPDRKEQLARFIKYAKAHRHDTTTS